MPLPFDQAAAAPTLKGWVVVLQFGPRRENDSQGGVTFVVDQTTTLAVMPVLGVQVNRMLDPRQVLAVAGVLLQEPRTNHMDSTAVQGPPHRR